MKTNNETERCITRASPDLPHGWGPQSDDGRASRGEESAPVGTDPLRILELVRNHLERNPGEGTFGQALAARKAFTASLRSL